MYLKTNFEVNGNVKFTSKLRDKTRLKNVNWLVIKLVSKFALTQDKLDCGSWWEQLGPVLVSNCYFFQTTAGTK